MAKGKSKLSPEAARILERYRTAGKPAPGPAPEGGPPGDEAGAPPPRPATTPPPPGAAMRRSGTRGK